MPFQPSCRWKFKTFSPPPNCSHWSVSFWPAFIPCQRVRLGEHSQWSRTRTLWTEWLSFLFTCAHLTQSQAIWTISTTHGTVNTMPVAWDLLSTRACSRSAAGITWISLPANSLTHTSECACNVTENVHFFGVNYFFPHSHIRNTMAARSIYTNCIQIL